MAWNAILSQLRDVLATLYPTVQDARRLIADAELNPNFIAFDNKAINNWHNILQEAVHRSKLDAIVQAARAEYSESPELLQSWQAYLMVIGQTEQTAPFFVKLEEQQAASGTPGNKYNIKLENAQGTVISDNAQVTQNFGGTYINTGGGPYVAGDVNTSGGGFVDRDKIDCTTQTTTKAKVEFTSVDLLAAAQKVTPQCVQDVLPHHKVIQRDKFNWELQNFLESSARYAVITGSAGVGKSVVMALQARDLLAGGWATFFMTGKSFSLDDLAELIIKDGLGHRGQLEWRQVLITPWQSQSSEQVKGLALLIDGLDQADTETMTRELTRLHRAISHIPVLQIKIVISCNDLSRAQQCLPFKLGGKTLANPDRSDSVMITLTDFNRSELTEALVAARQPGELPDPYAETLWKLLIHPAIFGLYADNPGISWNRLLDKHLQNVFGQAQERCNSSNDFIQEQLIQFVKLIYKHQSDEFRLDKDLLRGHLPELRVDNFDSPYIALCQLGLLTESDLSAGKRSVHFTQADAASYLLSLVLEREIEPVKQKTDETIEAAINAWIEEAYNFPVLIDGLLIWIDRFADKPRDRLLRILLSKVIESDGIPIDYAFRLIQPLVLEALFEIAAQKPLVLFSRYQKAARAIRFSTEMSKTARRRLVSRNSQIKQLALSYLGQNRDDSSTAELIDLLEDGEQDIRKDVYSAVAKIGEPVLSALLAFIDSPTESLDKRRRCLDAVSEIGIRNEKVSRALSGCLQEGIATGNNQLLKRALQTASTLRDRKQIPYAIRALGVNDWHIVRDAAQLLTELLSVDALFALQDAFRRTNSHKGDAIWQEQAANQILVAIAAIQTTEAIAFALEEFVKIIKGSSGLHPIYALSAAKQWNIPGVNSVVVEILVQSLANDPSGNSSGLGFDWLAERWRSQQLLEIVESVQALQQQGKDIARLTVDAIVASEAVQEAHQLYDHHKRVNVLHVLAKGQPANFVEEVARLLECPGRWHFDEEVCNALWVVADERAEPALIHRLEQLMAQPETRFYEFTPVLRALGTCGSERCLPLLIGYLKNATSLERNIPDECLYPLLLRNKIAPALLVELASDPQAQPSGRVAALVTLGRLDAKGYSTLFDTLLRSPDDSLVLAYAASMAGFAGNRASVPHLRRLLRKTENAFTANMAAEALAALDADDAASLSLIENVFESDYANTEHTLGFINALEHFQQSTSSLQVLLSVLDTAHHGHTEHAIIDALGAFLPDPSAKAKILQWLETWHGAHSDAGRQRTAARTLARYDPQFFIEQVNRLYVADRLYLSTRKEIARQLPFLEQQRDINRAELLVLITRLLCDTQFAVRELAGRALEGMDQVFCQQIYEILRATPDDWGQACAVRMLGFWGEHESMIEQFRYAERFHARYFADVALAQCAKRRALAELVKQYQSSDGLTRLSAYLAIQQHGTQQTIRTLRAAIHQEHLAYIFLNQLSNEVHKRVEKEHNDGAKKEEKALISVGTVYYN